MSELNTCITMLRRMHHHMQYVPDANKFKIQAYATAADALYAHGSIEGLQKIKGIGASMQAFIEEAKKNKVPKELKAAEKYGPPFEITELQRITGVGPKRALQLYEEHGIKNLSDLEKKIKNHEIVDPKLIAAFYDMGAVNERVSRDEVLHNITPVLDSIRKIVGYDVGIELVGSFRRFRPDIRDIDVLIGTTDAGLIKSVVAAVKKFSESTKLLDKEGAKKAEVMITIINKQRKLDMYFIDPKQWGSALMHFTGPDKYNVAVRNHAKSKKMKVSQYGVSKNNKIKRFDTEQKMCEYLGIPYLDPECRDNFVSVKQAQNPDLVTDKDVRGDFHIHTTESDGLASTDRIIKYFLQSRLTRMGISNHSQGSGNGLNETQAGEYHASIRGFKRSIKYLLESGRTKKALILCGAEVDIKSDGKLDYSDKFLQTLDYVILSIHHKTDFQTTSRLLGAIRHVAGLGVPAIVAHPSSRIIGYRKEADIDWPELFKTCVETNTVLEINGQGDRMDLPDNRISQAYRAGCVFVLSSDFHGKNPSDMKRIQHNAVMLARRGGVTRDRCINTDKALFRTWLGPRYDKIYGKAK